MSGVACAKAAIDNGAALIQSLEKQVGVLGRQLACMGASVQLSAPRGVYPTEEQEAEFLAASDTLRKAFESACNSFADVVNRISLRCDPTKPLPATP